MNNEDGSADTREPIVINGDEEILLYVRDRRKTRQYSIDNTVMDEWYPLIDATGYAIYSLLVRMSNEGAGESAHPGYTMIQKHLGISRSTVSIYVSMLEWCQLIYRDRPEIIVIQNGEKKKRRQGNRSNTYYILDVVSVTKERLESIVGKINESADLEGVGITEKYREKFNKAVKTWRPIQYHWSSRRARKIKTVVVQTSLFKDKKPEESPPSSTGSQNEKSTFTVATKQMFSDFGIVGSPAKELANAAEQLVLAWIWQCQIEEMDPKKAPGYVVKRLRETDSPGAEQVTMADHWLTMKANDREALKDTTEHMRLRGHKSLADALDENFMPDLVSESLDFYEKAYKAGALYTDI